MFRSLASPAWSNEELPIDWPRQGCRNLQDSSVGHWFTDGDPKTIPIITGDVRQDHQSGFREDRLVRLGVWTSRQPHKVALRVWDVETKIAQSASQRVARFDQLGYPVQQLILGF